MKHGLGNTEQTGRNTRSSSRQVPGYVRRTSRSQFELVDESFTLAPTTYNGKIIDQDNTNQIIGRNMGCFIKIGAFNSTLDDAPAPGVLEELLDKTTSSTVSKPGGMPLTWIRGHLLNGQLGGPGADPANLVMLTASANSQHSNGMESFIKKTLAILGGAMYHYEDAIEITNTTGGRTLDFALHYQILTQYAHPGAATISGAIPACLKCRVRFCVLIDGQPFYSVRSALAELNLNFFRATGEIEQQHDVLKAEIEEFFERPERMLFREIRIPQGVVRIDEPEITGWVQTVENDGWEEK